MVVDHLARIGYPAYVTAVRINHVDVYRVRVAGLKSRRATEEIAQRLERDGYDAPWIAK